MLVAEPDEPLLYRHATRPPPGCADFRKPPLAPPPHRIYRGGLTRFFVSFLLEGEIVDKLCKSCGESNPSLFYGKHKSMCRACHSSRSLARYYAKQDVCKAYYLKNREKYLDYYRVYGDSRRRAIGCMTASEYVAKQKRDAEARRVAKKNARLMERYLTLLLDRKAKQDRKQMYVDWLDECKKTKPTRLVVEKIRRSFRTRVRDLLSGKQKSSLKLPYSSAELRLHLERQFVGSMSWENYGTYWHIDHIVPLSQFAPDDGVAWCLSNLRPLEAKKNLEKSDRRLYLL